MAKARSALGSHGRHSERFGMPGTEPFGTRNSEPVSETTTGRPPVMTDAQLADLAKRLNDELGRPPKADELIAEAGGCQRKRALATILQLRQELATRAVRSQLMFPAEFEVHLRALIAEWLRLAAQHLAQRQAEFAESQEAQLAAADAHAEDLKQRIADLAKDADQQRRHAVDIQRRHDQLTSERDQLKAERDALRAVAEERQRVIDQLVLGPAMAAANSTEVTS